MAALDAIRDALPEGVPLERMVREQRPAPASIGPN